MNDSLTFNPPGSFIQSVCEGCVHKDVCKLKGEYEKELSKLQTPGNTAFTAGLSCKYYCPYFYSGVTNVPDVCLYETTTTASTSVDSYEIHGSGSWGNE